MIPTEIVFLLAGLTLLLLLLGIFLLAKRPRKDTKYYDKLLAAGVRTRDAGRNDKAQKYFDKIIADLKPSQLDDELAGILSQAFVLSGNNSRQQNRHTAALDAYRQAINLVSGREPGVPARPHLSAAIPFEAISLVASEAATRHDSSPEAVDSYLLYLEKGSGFSPNDVVIQQLKELCQVTKASNSGQLNFTLSLASAILAINPNLAWAQLAIGLAQQRRGQQVEAIAAFQRAEQLDPALAAAPFNLAQIYLAQNAPQLARAALVRSLSVDQDQPVALYQLARLLVDDADNTGTLTEIARTEALAHVSRACELAPDRADSWRLRGRIETMGGALVPARASLEKALSLVPDDVGTLNELATVLISLQDRSAAIAVMRRISRQLPNDAGVCERLAGLLLAQAEAESSSIAGIDGGNRNDRSLFAESANNYRRFLEQKPGIDSAIDGLGRALYGLGSYGEAVKVLRSAKNLTREGVCTLGCAYAHSNMMDAAIQTYKAYIGRFGSDGRILFHLGCAQARRAEWQMAFDAFAQAEALGDVAGGPQNLILYCRGVALLGLGDARSAGTMLEHAARLDTNDVNTLYALAVAKLNAGDMSAAMKAFARCLELNPRFAPAQFGIGLVSERSGEFAQAAHAYQLGLDMEPSWRPGWIRLGVVSAKAGAWSAAQHALAPLVQKEAVPDEARFYLGLAHAMSEEYAAALAAWEPLRFSRAADPVTAANRRTATYQLGCQHLERGEYEKTLRLWEQGLAEWPAHTEFRDALTETLVRMGLTLLAQIWAGKSAAGERSKAHAYLERALQLEAGETRARYYLGIDALHTGDGTAAIQHLRPIVIEDPDDHRAIYHLLLSYLAEGSADDALPLFSLLDSFEDSYGANLPIAKGNAAIMVGAWADAFAAYRSAL